jgi:hypothetical protein
MLEGFDPNAIEDESLRQVVIFLMNQVEILSAKVAEQAEEIQGLRDENSRLKGEQGKPRAVCQELCKSSRAGCSWDAAGMESFLNLRLRMTA